MVKAVVLEMLLGWDRYLSWMSLVDMSHKSKKLFKIQTFNSNKFKKSYLWEKKKQFEILSNF